MRALIVDDERNVREALGALLKLWSPETEVVGEASGVTEALRMIEDLNPDLVFLDVEMGDGTGFDLLNKILIRNFEVIFVTAHQHYAINAIRMSACDFLLKPVDPDDLWMQSSELRSSYMARWRSYRSDASACKWCKGSHCA